MVELYVRLITSGEINEKTGEAWKIEDVPKLWRDKVRQALENKG